MIFFHKKESPVNPKIGWTGLYLNWVADLVVIRERSFLPPVSTPAADGAIAGFDVLSVGDDLRATVFGDVGHLLPQLLGFLVFVLPRALRTARCALPKRRSP